ncbi:MAG: hypothetical protein [Caudoviricetes sp.]|nr:MAG: hypothetical protein [Caudoviricetes sp.]
MTFGFSIKADADDKAAFEKFMQLIAVAAKEAQVDVLVSPVHVIEDKVKSLDS